VLANNGVFDAYDITTGKEIIASGCRWSAKRRVTGRGRWEIYCPTGRQMHHRGQARLSRKTRSVNRDGPRRRCGMIASRRAHPVCDPKET
jgi:hypothetical protein